MTIGELKKILEKYGDDEQLYIEKKVNDNVYILEMILAVRNDCGTLILEGA